MNVEDSQQDRNAQDDISHTYYTMDEDHGDPRRSV